ncbi:acetoacetate decarboxylase family protein [Actinoplanes sp. M2I2]|uniref:acetoacetate decarboxylase family protein n=1 Tax=Actinoplanes sp. M2I2 TaxID=1734444 RepID=UPI002020B60E|nr:acetoacetate decarboxylase family protein [Actinoplanes sp. M2I2]
MRRGSDPALPGRGQARFRPDEPRPGASVSTSGHDLGVEFWTTPAAAAASLPTGLDPDPVHELTQSVLTSLKVDNAWIGSGDLRFLPSPREEIADLAIQRIGVGFRGSLSYTVQDLTILA